MHQEIERLVGLYDRGGLSRRQLLQGLFALGLGDDGGGGFAGRAQSPLPFQTRTLNHMTLYASNVARSKAFYQRLTGLPIQAEDKESCEFRLESGFLGIYSPGSGQQRGFNHFCFGIEKYEPQGTFNALKAAMPEAKPTLEDQGQVYIKDPDGVRVQFADVRYKR